MIITLEKKLKYYKDADVLESKMYRVLKKRFVERIDLETVGKELGVTRERIRQIEAKGLETITEYENPADN